MSRLARDERLALARQYLAQLENEQDVEASETLWRLSEIDEELFQGVGKLTRELHDAVVEISGIISDPRMGEITHQELPDAKERLSYVVDMTEQAANTTLNAIELSSPALEQISAESARLAREWQRFRARELKVEEFRELSKHLETFFEGLNRQSEVIQGSLSEVLMAQSYQDLTGQVVKRVSGLVQDVEKRLVDLLQIAGTAFPAGGKAVTEKKQDAGPAVPGVNDQGRVSDQDEVDDLLSELGF